MFADLLKVFGLYFGFLIALVGIVKLVFSLCNRYISFVTTIKPLIITALLANVFSFLLFKTTSKPGFYWGEIPADQYILLMTIIFFPIVCITVVLLWTLKKQLRGANKVNGT